MDDRKAIAARVIGIGLLVAAALVLIGFVTGQHGMVDLLAVVSVALAVLVGVPVWCVGWLARRRHTPRS